MSIANRIACLFVVASVGCVWWPSTSQEHHEFILADSTHSSFAQDELEITVNPALAVFVEDGLVVFFELHNRTEHAVTFFAPQGGYAEYGRGIRDSWFDVHPRPDIMVHRRPFRLRPTSNELDVIGSGLTKRYYMLLDHTVVDTNAIEVTVVAHYENYWIRRVPADGPPIWTGSISSKPVRIQR